MLRGLQTGLISLSLWCSYLVVEFQIAGPHTDNVLVLNCVLFLVRCFAGKHFLVVKVLFRFKSL